MLKVPGIHLLQNIEKLSSKQDVILAKCKLCMHSWDVSTKGTFKIMTNGHQRLLGLSRVACNNSIFVRIVWQSQWRVLCHTSFDIF